MLDLYTHTQTLYLSLSHSLSLLLSHSLTLTRTLTQLLIHASQHKCWSLLCDIVRFLFSFNPDFVTNSFSSPLLLSLLRNGMTLSPSLSSPCSLTDRNQKMGFLSFLYDFDPIEGPVPVSFPSFGAREVEREGRRRMGGETEEGFVRSQLCREKKERSVCVCVCAGILKCFCV